MEDRTDLQERQLQRRERILSAAIELFTAQGYHRTRTQQLCSQAGMSLRSFYEEFANKEAVLLALHDAINTAAQKRVQAALASSAHTDVRARITLMINTFLDSVTEDPRIPRLNYVEAVGVSPALEQQHQLWVARWSTVVQAEAERAYEQGLAPARDYRLTAVAIVGAVTGLVRHWQSNQPHLNVAEIAEEASQVVIAALTRPATPLPAATRSSDADKTPNRTA